MNDRDIRTKPTEILIDDITVITALKCDGRIRTDYVEVDDSEKDPRKAHCRWAVSAIGLSEDELNAIIVYIKRNGGKQGKKKPFNWNCTECGLRWLEHGPCSSLCNGTPPDFYRYDETKREVIEEKREAQEETYRDRINDRGAKLYEN